MPVAGNPDRACARTHAANSCRIGRRDAAALQPVQDRGELQPARVTCARSRRSRHRQGAGRAAVVDARAAGRLRPGATRVVRRTRSRAEAPSRRQRHAAGRRGAHGRHAARDTVSARGRPTVPARRERRKRRAGRPARLGVRLCVAPQRIHRRSGTELRRIPPRIGRPHAAARRIRDRRSHARSGRATRERASGLSRASGRHAGGQRRQSRTGTRVHPPGGDGPHRIDARETRIVHGTRDDVLRELDTLHRRHGIAEFVVDTPLADAAPRIASLRLLAGASADSGDPAASRRATEETPRTPHTAAVTRQPDLEGAAR